ncbi:major facilitator superfamily domain-containing protein 6 isoform X2 [Folsomia candida]|uniref:major facilitator superfamily domain-containing protein 6 isoform X2 n=1 Tax=Folsomia candida TaxID=158441 RepID=UPI000B904E96|nr:major facilitator superfamily domain-containing protein 6 isoform X2 [Folsomia candida]
MGLDAVNRRLLSPKLHYFLYFGGMASFWPFVTVFAKQLGVTEVPVGLLFTIAPITGLISMPLFGAIADRFKMKKQLFLIFNLINFVVVMLFAFLPTVIPTRNVAFECGVGTSYLLQNRTGFQAGVKNKCNVSEILLSSQSEHSLDLCNLKCDVTHLERQELCQVFLGGHKPSFCGSGDEHDNEDATSLITLQNLQVKTSHAIIVDEILHLPVAQVVEGEVEFGFSCSEKSILASCEVDCFTNQALDFRLQKIPEASNVYTSRVFWSYVALVLTTWIAFAVVTSVADALCFQSLGDQPHLYGVQRQWGAMGWGLFSLMAGALVDYRSQGSLIKDYSPCFYIIVVLLLLNFLVCYYWEVKEEPKPHSLGKSIWELITNPKIFVFILACIVVGTCTGLLWQFLFWYTEDIASCENMKYIKILQGLISIVQCFGGELPFFYISSWFIKTLGHVHCMTLVLGAFGLRFIIYSLLTNPWHILPVELLQGVTYGIFYSNMASYAYVVSPPGSAATVQGIVGAAFEGIGVGIGSFLGGFLYKTISGRLTFRVFGVVTFSFCVIHHLIMKLINRRFTPVAQADTEGYRNGHSKLEEMKDMGAGTKLDYDSDT